MNVPEWAASVITDTVLMSKFQLRVGPSERKVRHTSMTLGNRQRVKAQLLFLLANKTHQMDHSAFQRIPNNESLFSFCCHSEVEGSIMNYATSRSEHSRTLGVMLSLGV